MTRMLISVLALTVFFPTFLHAHGPGPNKPEWVAVKAPTKFDRSKLVDLGMSIETVVEDMSYGFVNAEELKKIKAAGFAIEANLPVSQFKAFDFPVADAAFHNYSELQEATDKLAADYPNLVHKMVIGLSLQNRDIMVLRIHTGLDEADQQSTRPGIIFIGGHHAREHLSVEVPLKLAEYLVQNYGKDPRITALLDHRDIYILPNLNPDGSENDINDGRYEYWRKNVRVNANSRCLGVDLNRNYGHGWGTGGSSKDPCSDVYMGPQAFSEPETRTVKRFLEDRKNIKMLLSFHTYSELILYPWGGTNDKIANAPHLQAYEKMAQTMAGWNGYTPEQASDLYIASGDTCDWAYGDLGIFAFTFELSPSGNDWGGGGFYPGARAIEPTFQANIKPSLYLIDLADDPLRSFRKPETTLFYGQ